MKLELFYYAQCPFCQMVLKEIKRLGLENHITLRNTLENMADRNFHLNTTGRTTVPSLYIDDDPMFESSDICKWLDSNQDKIKGK